VGGLFQNHDPKPRPRSAYRLPLFAGTRGKRLTWNIRGTKGFAQVRAAGNHEHAFPFALVTINNARGSRPAEAPVPITIGKFSHPLSNLVVVAAANTETREVSSNLIPAYHCLRNRRSTLD